MHVSKLYVSFYDMYAIMLLMLPKIKSAIPTHRTRNASSSQRSGTAERLPSIRGMFDPVATQTHLWLLFFLGDFFLDHSKSPLDHHLENILYFFPSTLSKSKVIVHNGG